MNMKNEKGKMKSEKVWKSLLFTFSLLLSTFTATAAMAGASVSLGTPQQRYPWNGKMDIPYTLAGTDAAKTYQLVTTLTVGGATKAVTNELGQVSDGNYTNTVDCAALFGTAVAQETATVKLAVLAYAKPAIAITPVTKLYGPFLIINLTPDVNGKFQTTECDYPPEGAWSEDGGWGDAYKRDYIVLRKVEAGTYRYGTDYNEPVSKTTGGFWVGVFEVTAGQYARVMGDALPDNPLVAKGRIRYDIIRGTSNPETAVTGESFMAKLCEKCVDQNGYKLGGFDLPTDTQWAIAYYADVTTQYYWGDSQNDADQYAWFNTSDWTKGSGKEEAQKVGLKKPNAWGLYDIAGNVQEWCRDVFNLDDSVFHALADAETYNTVVGINANTRPLRGGSFDSLVSLCAGSKRCSQNYVNGLAYIGFRLSRMSSK